MKKIRWLISDVLKVIVGGTCRRHCYWLRHFHLWNFCCLYKSRVDIWLYCHLLETPVAAHMFKLAVPSLVDSSGWSCGFSRLGCKNECGRWRSEGAVEPVNKLRPAEPREIAFSLAPGNTKFIPMVRKHPFLTAQKALWFHRAEQSVNAL
jgi:hypothetical protein